MRLRKIVLGEEHPTTLSTMCIQAHILTKLGRASEGQEIEKKVYEVRKRTLGEFNRSTL